MITIPFKKSVLRIGVPYTKKLFGISATFDDEILIFLGILYISFWCGLPNKAWSGLVSIVRRFPRLRHK